MDVMKWFVSVIDSSGEIAFKCLSDRFGWAKFPMINRIMDIPAFVPMTIIYGSRSWVDSGVGWQIKYMRKDSYVDVQVYFLRLLHIMIHVFAF